MTESSVSSPVHMPYPVVRDTPAAQSAGRLADLVQLAIQVLSSARSTEDRSEEHLIAAFARARQAPEGCPFDACHQFWLRGACDFPVCKFKRMQGPVRTTSSNG